MARYTPYGEYVAPNQFDVVKNPELTPGEAQSRCGPALAVAFARVNGRNPTLSEATRLARQFGWNPVAGMAGPMSQVKLMERMNIGAYLDDGVDDNRIREDVVSKRPVGISTAKHYYFADGYDDETGQYHVGATGLARIGGKKWMSLKEIQDLDGGVNGVVRLKTTPPPRGYDSSTSRDDGYGGPDLDPNDDSVQLQAAAIQAAAAKEEEERRRQFGLSMMKMNQTTTPSIQPGGYRTLLPLKSFGMEEDDGG